MNTLNVVANLAIVLGYALVPFTWLRYLAPALMNVPGVMLAGVMFFLTCALTHFSMVIHAEHDAWMVCNHVVQALSVLYFVVGLGVVLRRADQLRRYAEQIAADRLADMEGREL